MFGILMKQDSKNVIEYDQGIRCHYQLVSGEDGSCSVFSLNHLQVQHISLSSRYRRELV